MLINIIKAFFAVFGVMDPLGNTPVFISLTDKLDKKTKQSLALKAVLRAGAILLIFVFLGNGIISFFHISLPSFRIAGGIILILIGLQILFGARFGTDTEMTSEDISAVPLATPLIAGPGTITAVIIFSKEYGYAITTISIIANLIVSWLLFYYAHYVVKVLGKSGMLMFMKFMSLILVAIGVEFIRTSLVTIQ